MGLAAEDIARSLRGSWRLMSEGEKALPDLDLTRDGFWRSFLAFGIVVLRLRYAVAQAAFGSGAVALLLVLSSVVLDYGVVRVFGLA